MRWFEICTEAKLRYDTIEEEEEIYLAHTQQIKCKYESYAIQLSRVTGKPEGQLCRPP